MPVDRSVHDHVLHLLRPIRTRLSNLAARALFQLVNDSKKMQLVQIGVLDGETIDDAEHYQPYGFSSVPFAGAEAIVTFPNGDRSHPLVFAAADRRYRPTGGQPGEVTVYNNTGARVTLTKDGDIIVRAAPGRDVLVDDGSGTPEPLVKRSEFLAHGHPIVATGATTPCAGPVTGSAPAGSSSTFPGTDALKSK